MNNFKKCIFLTIMFLIVFACNRNYHNYITPSDFLVNNWYKFDNFRYQGSLRNGLPNGFGTVEYNNGTKVSGVFSNGILVDLEANYHIPKVGKIEGVVISGNLISGRISYDNGDVYTGSIKSYVPNGDGIFIKNNNDIFEGKFQNGKFTSGEFFESKTGSAFQGSFKNWKPDGDGIEIKSDGKAYPYIYSGEINQTESILQSRALDNVKRQNEVELNKIEAKIIELSKQKEVQATTFSKEKSRLEEEGGEMYDRCACTLGLKLCLGVIDAAKNTAYYYSAYHEEFNLPAPYGSIYSRIDYVALPRGSAKAAIKQAFLNQIEIISECVDWNSDRDNYERSHKNRLANLIASNQKFIRNVESEINTIRQQKELAYQRQQRESRRRQEAELNKIKKEMEDSAQKAAKQRQERCAKYPDCCRSAADVERLKAAKKYSACARNE